jgi:hypothetical protein
MTEIFKKLATARAMIKKSPIKKAGKNTFSNYDYFTPEQISHMVHEAETANGLVHLFNMERAEHGIHGKLSIIDTETGETLTFIQATEIPEIKATNAAQQIGGAVTYTRRYMLMTAYDIADNSLDFDARDNRDVKSKPVMPDDRFKKMLDYLKTRPQDAAKQLSKARDQFRFSDAQEATLLEWEDNL